MDAAMELEASVLAQQKPMLAAMAQGESEVQRFYNNSVVFLTGGSGFLGKQLIEKLFRCCHISKVYMLLRGKKGKTIQERRNDVLSDTVFDNVRKQQGNFSEKVVAIEGDVADIKLGIKDEDWKILIDEVDVIFHVAATTRFDETLRTATLINVRGTREALLLGKACKKLRSYVHVSTAYTHATANLIGGDVEEKFYPSPVPPEALISMAGSMEPERLNNISTNLIKGWPNSYTFTKTVAEDLVRTTSDGLPICIVRPAIVLSTYLEPAPGWLDPSCLYGVMGVGIFVLRWKWRHGFSYNVCGVSSRQLIFGGALGVLHTSLVNINIKLGFIPCDYVNNAIIVAARETASNQLKGGNYTKIYTVSSTMKNPVTFKLFSDTLHGKARDTYSSPKSVYYCFSIYTVNKLIFGLTSLFLHFIPAYIADFVCVLLGKKRRFAKLTKKIYSSFLIISFFALNEWNFIDDNVSKLYSRLSNQDKAIFNFNVAVIDWRQYLLILCIGIRKYIMKDGLKDTAYGIKKQKFLKYVNYAFLTLYIYCIWKLCYFLIIYIACILIKL